MCYSGGFDGYFLPEMGGIVVFTAGSTYKHNKYQNVS